MQESLALLEATQKVAGQYVSEGIGDILSMDEIDEIDETRHGPHFPHTPFTQSTVWLLMISRR